MPFEATGVRRCRCRWCEFSSELVEAVEVGVELVVAVGRPDETTIAKPIEDAVDRVAVVVAPVGNLGYSSRIDEGVQHLKRCPGQQLREVNVGMPADEGLVEFNGVSI